MEFSASICRNGCAVNTVLPRTFRHATRTACILDCPCSIGENQMRLCTVSSHTLEHLNSKVSTCEAHLLFGTFAGEITAMFLLPTLYRSSCCADMTRGAHEQRGTKPS